MKTSYYPDLLSYITDLSMLQEA